MNVSAYLRESVSAMQRIEDHEKTIEVIADSIWDRLARGGTVYWMGNGGSASDAQHLATELVAKFLIAREPIKSVALATNTSLITALANDEGYESIFVRQVDAFVNSPDVVIGISTSGKSNNVLKALQLAKSRGALVVSFTGLLTNDLDDCSDFVFHADSQVTGVIQQMHITFGQAICLALENKFIK